MGRRFVDFCRQFNISPFILDSLSVDSKPFIISYTEGCHDELFHVLPN